MASTNGSAIAASAESTAERFILLDGDIMIVVARRQSRGGKGFEVQECARRKDNFVC